MPRGKVSVGNSFFFAAPASFEIFLVVCSVAMAFYTRTISLFYCIAAVSVQLRSNLSKLRKDEKLKIVL